MFNELGNLPKLINLPANPIEVKWKVEEQHESNDWSLTAMLKFETRDFQSILEKSTKHEETMKPKIFNQYLFEWLPKSIYDQYQKGASSEFIAVDAYQINPEAFVDINKSPLVNGNIIVFEKENILLLHLFTM